MSPYGGPTPQKTSYPLKLLKLFSLKICKCAIFVVPLHPKAQRRGLEGGKCPLSESQLV